MMALRASPSCRRLTSREPLVEDSARAEQHNRNVALGPGLVLVVLGPLRRHDRPDASLVLARPGTGPDGEDLVPHLDLHVGVGDQVPVPSGIVGRPTLRCHDDVVLTVPTIDERELPDLTGLPTGRVQDETVHAIPVVTHFAARRFVLPDVLVTKEAVVRHAARVPRPRRGSDPHRRDDASPRRAESSATSSPSSLVEHATAPTA